MTAATTITDNGDEIQVTAEIESLDQLFEAPDFDPFSEQPRTSAVVDDIIAHLRSRHMRRWPAVSLTLLLPAGEELADAVEASASALKRYADLKTAEMQQEIEITIFEGRARLPWGVIVAVTVVVLVFLMHALLPKNLEPLLLALTPVVSVVIWVAIWNPAEALLYENWMLRRQKAAYVILGKTSVNVKGQ
jgi:hypothetical protein